LKIRTETKQLQLKKRSGKVSSCKHKSDKTKIKTILKEEIQMMDLAKRFIECFDDKSKTARFEDHGEKMEIDQLMEDVVMNEESNQGQG